MSTALETNRLRLFWRRWVITYRRKRMLGHLNGAFRVLIGKSASVPKGLYDTPLGRVLIRDYYGGLKLTLPQGELYWNAYCYDGWGAGEGTTLFAQKMETRGAEP